MTRKDAEDVVAFVAELLRGVRAMRGHGLRQIAKASGVSLATLSRIERGGIPEVLTFLRLVAFLRREAKKPPHAE
ncbi:MAG: helix-turn-helix domain-containing protein [Acidobacteria bacterium]|nr:helix-turn-helix domain-containing protein [Acidobacteriota bacterium]